eukprot:8231062-Alexandrium_andersonii.AAC.1
MPVPACLRVFRPGPPGAGRRWGRCLAGPGGAGPHRVACPTCDGCCRGGARPHDRDVPTAHPGSGRPGRRPGSHTAGDHRTGGPRGRPTGAHLPVRPCPPPARGHAVAPRRRGSF